MLTVLLMQQQQQKHCIVILIKYFKRREGKVPLYIFLDLSKLNKGKYSSTSTDTTAAAFYSIPCILSWLWCEDLRRLQATWNKTLRKFRVTIGFIIINATSPLALEMLECSAVNAVEGMAWQRHKQNSSIKSGSRVAEAILNVNLVYYYFHIISHLISLNIRIVGYLFQNIVLMMISFVKAMDRKLMAILSTRYFFKRIVLILRIVYEKGREGEDTNTTTWLVLLPAYRHHGILSA